MTGMAQPWLALIALVAVIALVLLARRVAMLLPANLLPRVAAGRDGALALEQVLPLDARRRLVLVRCGERRLLLLIGPAQDMALGWLDPPAERAP
jgi:flagellar protein FliO/FliZ